MAYFGMAYYVDFQVEYKTSVCRGQKPQWDQGSLEHRGHGGAAAAAQTLITFYGWPHS